VNCPDANPRRITLPTVAAALEILASGITSMILGIPDHAAVMFEAVEGLCEQPPRTDDPTHSLSMHGQASAA
jgi:hypothetical protein